MFRKEQRLAEKRSYIKEQKTTAITKLIDQAGWLISGILFFVIHWTLYKRQENLFLRNK